MIQTSFNEANLKDVTNSGNGFVYSCIEAYNNHYHLTIRPEDVWFAILSQLGIYINGNAEELRHVFVAHKGKKELVVYGCGTIDTFDFATFPPQIMREMSKHMNDPDLPEWIKPDFSTTTPDDMVVACILMMGAMQNYFDYSCTMCGLPSVTLLGERNDWQKLFDKADRLKDISEQAATFHSLLKPVLGYFVRSFDEPDSPEVVSFWNHIAHFEDGGSGPAYLSGWLTAFCFWDSDGKMLYQPPDVIAPGNYWANRVGCDLDGTLYHVVDDSGIPAGYMGVPVKVIDDIEYKCRMVAGSVGIRCASSGKPIERTPRYFRSSQQTESSMTTQEVVGLDSVQPLSGWWMFDTEGEKEPVAEEGKQESSVKEYSNVNNVEGVEVKYEKENFGEVSA
jgi:hypothetical protein